MHGTLDMRLMSDPLPYLAYYPAVVPQSELKEAVVILPGPGTADPERRIAIGPPAITEPLAARESYDAPGTDDIGAFSGFGPTRTVPLGDVALARSGDKGANVNIGLFVRTDEAWRWFRLFMTRQRLKTLMGDDWRDDFFLERVEFAHIRAVHFVVYGVLGRGVSGSARLDCLGKGFAEFVRDVHVEVPVRFLGGPHVS
jgi:hypothetical protein